MVSVVLLNYNDAENCIDQINRLKKCDLVTHIVVVDNSSSDNSVDLLRPHICDNVYLIRSRRNGGYSYGNMVGAHYAKEKFNDEFILISNTDTIFDDDNILKMINVLRTKKEIACVAPVMLVNGELDTLKYPPAFKHNGFISELLDIGPVCRRLFHGFLHYTKKDILRYDKRILYVKAPAGALMMFKSKAFFKVCGFDANVFLYEEEKIISKRLEKCGYKSVLILDSFYHHMHSLTINNVIKSALKRQQIREDSAIYYCKNYLKCGFIRIMLLKLMFKIVRLEMDIYYKFKGDRS